MMIGVKIKGKCSEGEKCKYCNGDASYLVREYRFRENKKKPLNHACGKCLEAIALGTYIVANVPFLVYYIGDILKTGKIEKLLVQDYHSTGNTPHGNRGKILLKKEDCFKTLEEAKKEALSRLIDENNRIIFRMNEETDELAVIKERIEQLEKEENNKG